MAKFAGRTGFIWAAVGRPIWAILSALWTVIGIWGLAVAQLLPPAWAEKLPNVFQVVETFVGLPPFWSWVVIGIVLLAIACIEYSFRQTSNTDSVATSSASNEKSVSRNRAPYSKDNLNDTAQGVKQKDKKRRVISFVSAASVEDMRAKNDVEHLADIDSGKNFSEMPIGTFGFIEAYNLPEPNGWDIVEINGYKNNPTPRPVYKTRTFESQVEVHKTSTNEPYIVGFVSREKWSELREKAGSKGNKFPLFFEEWGEFNKCVAVPYTNISDIRYRSLNNCTNVIDITIDD